MNWTAEPRTRTARLVWWTVRVLIILFVFLACIWGGPVDLIGPYPR